MTANDMAFSFKLKFDSLFEFSAPAYDDRQVGYLLTEAQYRVFIDRYNPMGNKYQKGFESDEQRRRDLEQLIKPALYDATSAVPTGVETITISSQQGGVHPGGQFFDMPTGFLYAVEEAATLKTTPGNVINPKESWVKPVKHDEYLANITNPFKQPYKDLVWRMDVSRYQHAEGTSTAASAKRTELILPSGYAVERYRVRYLSTPPDIVVDQFDLDNQRHCVLDETLHRAIVDEAVVMAQAAIRKSEYQVGLSEANRSE